MNYWQQIYFSHGGFQNPRASALIMAAAWSAMAEWPDVTVAQNACMNAADPVQTLSTLDWRHIPVPWELLRALQAA